MAKMVARNRQSPQAHSLWAQYLHEHTTGQEKVALAEAEKAATLAPDDFDVLLLAADLFTLAGKYEKALGYAERAITHNPKRAGGFRHLAFCNTG